MTVGQTVELEPLIIVLRPAGLSRTACLFEITGRNIAMDTPQQLYEALMARRADLGADEPIIIRPRPNVRWEFVVEAFNQAVRAKCKNIAFAASL